MNPTRLIAALAAITLSAGTLHAQQPNANAGAFGMAGNFTAAARNYDAVAWNPANLGLPGNSVASFNIAGVNATSGLDPVGLGMIGKFNGTTIPTETKDAWLQLIGDGVQRGRVDGGVSLFALSIRNVALQVGTSGYGDATLNQDAAEMLLHGNAGRTGVPRDYQFAGSSVRGAAFTTGAASVGFPIPVSFTHAPGETFTVGVTAKYVMGNAMARAEDGGSVVTPSNATVSFPMIYGGEFDLGRGVGMDVGVAWHSGPLTMGMTVQNAINSFAWDTTRLKLRLGTASFDGTTSSSNFDDTTYALAPLAMREAVAAERFSPTLGGGVVMQVSSALLLTADARVQTGDGIAIGPRSQVGAGLEFSGVGFLPIRLGAAKITDGWQGAAGIGLRLGDNHVGVSAMLRERGTARETGVMVNLIALY